MLKGVSLYELQSKHGGNGINSESLLQNFGPIYDTLFKPLHDF